MARKVKNWSEMLEEIQFRRSFVYREGCKFVYDSGDLPDSLVGVAPGTVLALRRPHGITATQMPGKAEDWIVIGSGEGGSIPQIVDEDLDDVSTNAVQNKVIKEALDGKVSTVAQNYTDRQKKNARTNIGAQEDIASMDDVQPINAALNDREADVVPVTNEVKALGYKVLNPAQSFSEQVTAANTVYEIRDYFDISGTEQEPAMATIPANCKLRFEGGMLGGEFVTLQGNYTLVESDSVCIQKNVKIGGTWGNDVVYTKWFEFVSAKDAYLPAAAGTEGVMAPFFEENTYYKIGRNYVLLTNEPDDWQTDWSSYYEIVNNTYVNVSDVAPEYVPNVYYALTEEGEYEKLTSNDPPEDWETNYMNYYTDNTGTHVTGVAPEFNEDSYYEDAGVGYEKLLQQPDDWFANWSNYYIEDSGSYITPNGIINNPNATNNAIVFKQLQDIINGTKGCKVEFEKGYYQSSTLGNARGTVVINEVEYEIWPTNLYARDSDVVLNIFELPYLDINLNGSTLKALKTNCPAWSFFRFNGIEQLKVHNGEITGYAAQFDYPQYWDRSTYPNSSGTISTNYERVWLLMVAGGNCELYNLYIHNSTGNCISVGKRLWKFNNGDVKSYDVINAHVHDCEFSHCGRNGVGMGNGDYVTLERLYIHHVGSFNGNSTVDTYTNIMGYLPMAGIDVESDEKKESNPIVIWDSLKIHHCAGKAFGFAKPSKSLMQSFYATGLDIEGSCLPNNIKVLNAEPIFDHCNFVKSYGEVAFLGKALYRHCTFDIRTQMYIGDNTFEDCQFIDNIPETQTDTMCLTSTVDWKDAKFINCSLDIKHNSILRYADFESCNFVFDKPCAKVNIGGSKVVNSIFKSVHSTNGVLDTYNIQFTATNTSEYYGTTFIGCQFENIHGTGNADFSMYAFRMNRNLSFLNCNSKDSYIRIYTVASNKTYTIQRCSFNELTVASHQNSDESMQVIISDSLLETLSIRQCKLVKIENSTFSIGSKGWMRANQITIRNCNANFQNGNSSIADYIGGVVINDSVVTLTSYFNNKVIQNNTSIITMNNCYIKSGVSQSLYKGACVDCTFETNADSGTSAQRPPYNLVVGQSYYDTNLGKPIYWNGLSWVDGNGNHIFDNSGSLQTRLAITSPIKGQQFKLTREGETDVYLIYGDYGWLNATDRTPWFDDSGDLNAMYDKYNYTLLIAEPSTWATAYNTYYKIVDGVYTKLNAFEKWAVDTFYQLDVNTYKGIQVKLTDVDTELHDKVVKWNGTKYINIVDNIALKAGTPTLAFGEVEEEIDGEQVSVTQATITSTSSGKIYYTKNGDAPESTSSEYSNPIDLATRDQIKAICIRDHMDNSAVGFVKVATPVVSFNRAGILTITCDTADAKIYYTTDGSEPSTASTEYDSSASVTIAKGVTVNAIAVLIGRVNSEKGFKKRS